jgi:hypothetical protein
VYKAFSAKNFRLFKSLGLTHLGRVNLISGKNCIGKTSLLEALWLHSGAYKPDLALQLDALRGMALKKLDTRPQGVTPWDSLFRDFEVHQVIELESEDTKSSRRIMTLRSLDEAPPDLRWLTPMPGTENTKDAIDLSSAMLKASRVLELSYSEGNSSGKHFMFLGHQGSVVIPAPPPVPFNAHIMASIFRGDKRKDAELFGNVQAKGEDERLVAMLKAVLPDIKQVFVRVQGGEPTFYANVGTSKTMPLPLMGEGVSRLWGMALRMADAPAGIVLIDEIENGLHCSVLANVWKALGEAASKYDVQLFATTHSFECISAAHKVFSNTGCDFRFHRLDKMPDGEIRTAAYDCETLGAAIESNFEVR